MIDDPLRSVAISPEQLKAVSAALLPSQLIFSRSHPGD